MTGRSRGARTARCQEARGFTLVELLLAIGLVAVLLALALPAYTSHRNKVLSGHAAKEIAMMSAGIEAWRLDNRAYPPSLAAAGFGNRLDPWGRAYRYYRIDGGNLGFARKDRALNPINTDFDLYSVGPDGVSHSQLSHRNSDDDVVRAGNGRFVGIAKNF
jgi:general secretion pathway protein G